MLFAAGGVGMAYVAGFGKCHHVIESVNWWWLVASLGSVVIAFVGYLFAYRGIEHVEGGPELCLPWSPPASVAFSPTAARRWTSSRCGPGGADRREAKVRVSALAGFEHGVLALILCPAAIVAWALGVGARMRATGGGTRTSKGEPALQH